MSSAKAKAAAAAAAPASKAQANAFAAFFQPKRKAPAAAADSTEAALTEGKKEAEPASKQPRTEAHTDAHTSSSSPPAPAAAASTPASPATAAAAVTSTPTKKKPTAGQRKHAASPVQAKEEAKDEKMTVTAATVPEAKEDSTPADVQMEDAAKREPAATPVKSKPAAATPASPAAAKPVASSPSPSPSSPSPSPSAKPTAAKPASAAKAAAKKAAEKKEKKPAAAAASSKKKKNNSKLIRDDEDEEEEREEEAEEHGGADAEEEEEGSSKKSKKKKVIADEEEEEEDIDWGETAAALVEDDEHIESEDGAAAASSSTASGAAFDPIKSATWKAGEAVPYSVLAAVFERIEAEGSRLLTVGWLSDMLRSVIALSPDQLLPIVYLCCNQIAPAYEGKETMVGDATLLKAIAEATGGTVAKVSISGSQSSRERARAAQAESVSSPPLSLFFLRCQLKVKFQEIGDLGEVAMTSRGSQKTMFKMSRLTCGGVYKAFRDLADLTGKASGQRKADLIKKLLVSCEGPEARYIIRALQGNLRIGMAEKGVISALARAVTYTPPTLPGSTTAPILDIRRTIRDKTKLAALLERNVHLINQAYTEIPNHKLVLECILKHGVTELPNKCFLAPGVPVKVMLGKPTTGVDAILEKFKDLLFTLEYKVSSPATHAATTRGAIRGR